MTSVSAHRSEIVSFEHRPPQSRSSHAWRGQKKPRAKVAKIMIVGADAVAACEGGEVHAVFEKNMRGVKAEAE